MSLKEERIEAEVRRRAFERVRQLEEQNNRKLRRESNLEALESIAELPREELDRIDREVRAEMSAKGSWMKIALAATAGVLLIGGAVLLLKMRQPPVKKIETETVLPQPASSPAKSVRQEPAKQEMPIARKDTGLVLPVVQKDTGPILAKSDAEKVLQDPLLDCLHQSGHYAMIVRIGQGYKAPNQGPLAPLIIVDDAAIVDYRDVVAFTETPLGRCVETAARGVRTRAFRGNYMRFALTNPAVSDPLAQAAKTIDRKAAETALSALDDEARDCADRHPQYAEPGKAISLSIRFRGVDGTVDQVLPFYVNESPYRNCLAETFGKATVPPFRRLHEKVLHKLSP